MLNLIFIKTVNFQSKLITIAIMNLVCIREKDQDIKNFLS